MKIFLHFFEVISAHQRVFYYYGNVPKAINIYYVQKFFLNLSELLSHYFYDFLKIAHINQMHLLCFPYFLYSFTQGCIVQSTKQVNKHANNTHHFSFQFKVNLKFCKVFKFHFGNPFFNSSLINYLYILLNNVVLLAFRLRNRTSHLTARVHILIAKI